MKMFNYDNYFCCENRKVVIKKKFFKPPVDEPKYKNKNYYRELCKCLNCGHFFNKSNIDFNKIYKKKYSQISHGRNLLKKFNFIKSLNKKSDNFHRVNRILKFIKKNIKSTKIKVLDIGSGFGVFPISLKEAQPRWEIYCVEPDEYHVKFIKKFNIKVKKTFIEQYTTKQKFDLISLNKVLEHTENPKYVLNKVSRYLKRKGFIYIELPNAETASKDELGLDREEFYADHNYIFSRKSLNNLILNCNLKKINIHQINEPSGKYSLISFIKK